MEKAHAVNKRYKTLTDPPLVETEQEEEGSANPGADYPPTPCSTTHNATHSRHALQ